MAPTCSYFRCILLFFLFFLVNKRVIITSYPNLSPDRKIYPNLLKRGNSLETPNVWGLSSFHPNVSKQPPPPQCLGFCLLFTPRLLSRRAGSDVDATAAAHRTWKPRQHRESRRLHQFPALPGQPLPLPTDPTGLNPPRWSLPVPILPFPPLPPVPQLPAFPGFPPIPFFKP